MTSKEVVKSLGEISTLVVEGKKETGWQSQLAFGRLNSDHPDGYFHSVPRVPEKVQYKEKGAWV